MCVELGKEGGVLAYVLLTVLRRTPFAISEMAAIWKVYREWEELGLGHHVTACQEWVPSDDIVGGEGSVQLFLLSIII